MYIFIFQQDVVYCSVRIGGGDQLLYFFH